MKTYIYRIWQCTWGILQTIIRFYKTSKFITHCAGYNFLPTHKMLYN